MKDLGQTIQKALTDALDKNSGFEVDLIPVPSAGDRMVKLRTLEEALADFEGDGDTVGYLVQIKRSRKPQPQPQTHALRNEDAGPLSAKDNSRSAPKGVTDGIYLSNGQTNVPFLIKNAGLLFNSREYALARNIYKSILQTGERSGYALLWMGKCYEAEGKFAEAQNHYEESITYHPTLEAYQCLSAILTQLKKDQQAAELLERASYIKDLDKATRVQIHLACGNSWLRASRPEQAEKHYLKALEIDPAQDSVETNLGALYLQIGKIHEAKAHFEAAIHINPKSDKGLGGLASCFLAEGNKRKAHDYFAKSLDIDLNNPTAIYHLVRCAYEIKSYVTAARILENYIEAAPVNTNLMYSLAGLQFHLGRTHEALSTVRRILVLQPGHNGAKELLQKLENSSSSAI